MNSTIAKTTTSSKEQEIDMNIRTTQQGFSLVEILLVLGLIAAIAIAAFVIYPAVRLSQDVNDVSAKISEVIGSAKETVGTRPYTGLNRTSAISSGIGSDASLRTPWGLIDPNVGVPATVLTLSMNLVPQAACKKLISRLVEQSAAVRINASSYVHRRPPVGPVVNYNPLTGPTYCTGATNTVTVFVQ